MGKAARKQNRVKEDVQVIGMKNIRSKGLHLGIVAGILVVLGVATVFALNIPGFSSVQKVKPVNGVVSIPVAKVSDGKAHFYQFKDSGKDISFFVVKDSDGAIHTAFDTCDVCYKAKKGYEQKDDFMVCKNCNQRFAIAKIGPHAIGGCNPTYLPSAFVGANVIVKATDLQSGAKYF
ncbi:protein of unknown function DUF2318 [Geotalea daltonii FRC-32]|uniref:Membrane iron-sulfur containing protein FtrD-like domain-containing protein n=2 Tax=Geotalea TaxID=2910589 RepID=B9M0Q2_GEODF|nr:protein of unknown function DUF2318 [Geotalea daltonii FRC-32]